MPPSDVEVRELVRRTLSRMLETAPKHRPVRPAQRKASRGVRRRPHLRRHRPLRPG